MAQLLDLPVEIRQVIFGYIVNAPLPSKFPQSDFYSDAHSQEQAALLETYASSASSAYLMLSQVCSSIKADVAHLLRLRSQQLHQFWVTMDGQQLLEVVLEPPEEGDPSCGDLRVWLRLLVRESLFLCNRDRDHPWSGNAMAALYFNRKLSDIDPEERQMRDNGKDAESKYFETELEDDELEDLLRDALGDLNWELGRYRESARLRERLVQDMTEAQRLHFENSSPPMI